MPRNRYFSNHLLAPVFCGLLLWSFAATINPAQAQRVEETQVRLNHLADEIDASKNKREQLASQAEEEESFLATISTELVLRAERSRIQENLLNAIEVNIGNLGDEINAITQGLMAKRERLAQLLAALERLSQHPPALVMLRPNESLDTIRSASLLSHILPSIRVEAEKLKLEMTELEAGKQALSEEKRKEQEALELLKNEQGEMDVLLNQRQNIYSGIIKETTNTDAYIARLVDEAETLEALLESLLNNRTGDGGAGRDAYKVPENYPSNRPITQAKGNLAFPAHGVVSARYGSQTIDGKLKGIRIKPDSNSQVLSPYDGQVVFSGLFRNYGQLLIIDHGEGYHSLLSGLSDMYGSVGQWVLTGEPVGFINKTNLDSESARTNGNEKRNELYVEMRHNGVPINPTPWIAR
ncbi:MAG: peptidoglycan DD-metalloendopeptidase family protein [Sphingomonadales bacterium]|nr:peptidoglycan DD-metalloendopeptidase family protein [Sphingomonadales bacterium]